MYVATNPSYRLMVSATHLLYEPIVSRRSSGSSRDDSAVEPTRSQNITVSCRRSALSTREVAGTTAGGLAVSSMGLATATELGGGLILETAGRASQG